MPAVVPRLLRRSGTCRSSAPREPARQRSPRARGRGRLDLWSAREVPHVIKRSRQSALRVNLLRIRTPSSGRNTSWGITRGRPRTRSRASCGMAPIARKPDRMALRRIPAHLRLAPGSGAACGRALGHLVGRFTEAHESLRGEPRDRARFQRRRPDKYPEAGLHRRSTVLVSRTVAPSAEQRRVDGVIPQDWRGMVFLGLRCAGHAATSPSGSAIAFCCPASREHQAAVTQCIEQGITNSMFALLSERRCGEWGPKLRD